MILFSIVSYSQGSDYVKVHRDTLFNALLNLSELKVKVNYLEKKSNNQKLIIQSQGVVIEETEVKVDILTEHIRTVKSKTFWLKLWAFLKGVAVGALVVLVI
ncbi:MAG: hypothetical protein AAF348_07430 [Bacteroidota bacterium]